MWRCPHLHALRGAGQKRIDIPSYLAEIFVKRNDVPVPTAKNQSFLHPHAGDVHQSVFGKIKILGNMSIKCRSHQATRPLVGPAVIRTNEVSNVAGIRATNLGAPMTAAVQKHMHGTIAVAHHHHWCTTQVSGNKISGCRNLCLVGQKYPSAIENPLHLEAEYLVAYENIAAHQTAPPVDPAIILGCRSPYRHGPPL